MAENKKEPHPIRDTALVLVGITGLEPATSRPPDVCATNCAKSRSLFAIAKVRTFVGTSKYFGNFLQKKCYLLLFCHKIF